MDFSHLHESLRAYLQIPRVFIYSGQSGAGKGMQSARLKEYIETHALSNRKIIRCETGELFRSWVTTGTYTAELSKKNQERGILQPPMLSTMLVAQFLDTHYTGEEHLIFDGSPRTFPEAMLMENMLGISLYNVSHPDLFILHVTPEVAHARLMGRGRGDSDTLEKVQQKTAWFEPKTIPALEHLRAQSDFRVHDIDGEQEPDAVFKEILEKMILK